MKHHRPALIGLFLGIALAVLLAWLLPEVNGTMEAMRSELDDYRLIFISMLPMIGLISGLIWSQRRGE